MVMPLHAATCIVLTMCGFIIGFGLGYLMRKPHTITRTIRVPMSGREIAEELHQKYGDKNDPRRLDLGE